MVRMMRGGRGRGARGFVPVQMVQSSQRLMVPASSMQPSFYPTTRERGGGGKRTTPIWHPWVACCIAEYKTVLSPFLPLPFLDPSVVSSLLLRDLL